MKCPLCRLEMRITSSRNIIVNDDTPDEETRLFKEQELSCMNKECKNYGKVVETKRNELTIG